MFERTQETCDRYLDRIAQLAMHSNEKQRRALLIIAARFMRELEEVKLQDDLGVQLIERVANRHHAARPHNCLEPMDIKFSTEHVGDVAVVTQAKGTSGISKQIAEESLETGHD